MDNGTVTLKLDGLNQVIKALKKQPPKIKVGVLKDAPHPNSDGSPGTSTLVQIAAVHEYGSLDGRYPVRSYLRMPLALQLPGEIRDAELVTEEALEDIKKTGSFMYWASRIGDLAVAVVLDAFDTQGYGQWAPWKNGYTSKTGMILQDTQALRDSINREVLGE